MREERRVVYEASDYERIKNSMNLSEIIDSLFAVEDGWLGDSRYYGQKDYEGTESDFNLYKMHKALQKATDILDFVKLRDFDGLKEFVEKNCDDFQEEREER